MSRRAVRGAVLLLLVAMVATTLVLAAQRLDLGPFADPQRVNRFAQSPQFVDPGSSAATWAAGASSDDPAAVLATTPTGIWITPEAHPTDEVGSWVASLATQADDTEHVPLFVIYGLPQRDCESVLSAGGTTPEAYLPWLREIAEAAASVDRSAVILEPDALATAETCGLRDERVRLLSDAVGVLADAGVTTYVDAGHSAWIAADDMGELLDDVGVDRVRGFATNVSNFQTTADEAAYAERLLEHVPGAHFVIDTGRNGNGASDEWCNPSGRSLGDPPGFVDDGTPLDALLWIKPPGESDGTCGGGPEAGTFWPQRAQELVSARS